MLVTISVILSLVACGNDKEIGGSETEAISISAVVEESTDKESETVNDGENKMGRI